MARRVVHGYSLELHNIQAVRAFARNNDTTASRIVNRAIADFLARHRAEGIEKVQ